MNDYYVLFKLKLSIKMIHCILERSFRWEHGIYSEWYDTIEVFALSDLSVFEKAQFLIHDE